MAQPQPRGEEAPAAKQEPIKYGDVYAVKGELAGQPIAPLDAAAMRAAEEQVEGVQVPRESGGGFSSAGFMEQAAQYNQALGAVQPGQATQGGVDVTQDAVPGGRIVTEFVAGGAGEGRRRERGHHGGEAQLR